MPVEGVKVDLYEYDMDDGSETYVASKTTDVNGYFSFSGLVVSDSSLYSKSYFFKHDRPLDSISRRGGWQAVDDFRLLIVTLSPAGEGINFSYATARYQLEE